MAMVNEFEIKKHICEIGKRISEAGDSGENVATALENLVVGPIVETVCKVVMFVLVT